LRSWGTRIDRPSSTFFGISIAMPMPLLLQMRSAGSPLRFECQLSKVYPGQYIVWMSRTIVSLWLAHRKN
jgi:hypothetical protein